MTRKFLLTLSALSIASVSSCFAITANGSIGFNSTGGSVTYSGGAGGVNTATAVNLPIPNATTSCGTPVTNICEQITSIDALYLGITNDFSAAGLTPESVNNDITFANAALVPTWTLDMTFAALPTFLFSSEDTPANRFKFVATAGLKQGSTLGNTNFLNVFYSGTFSDAGGTYTPNAATLSLTFTQTGGNTGTVTYAGSFATPPSSSSSTPEPATLALMGGALIGFGLIRRKRFVR